MSKRPLVQAFVLGGLGVSLALSGGSASAQQAVADAGRPVGSPACDKYANQSVVLDARCEIGQIKARTEEARLEGVEADRQTALARAQASASDRQSSCVDAMKAGIHSGRYTVEAVRAAYGGQSVRDADACAVLARLTKG